MRSKHITTFLCALQLHVVKKKKKKKKCLPVLIKKKKLSQGSHFLGCQFQSHGKNEVSALVVIAFASH